MQKIAKYIITLVATVAMATSPAWAQQEGRTRTQAEPGESIDMLLTRCKIDVKHHNLFIAINWPRLTSDDMLMLGFNYYLPNDKDIANSAALVEREKKARAEKQAAKAGSQTAAPQPQQAALTTAQTTAAATTASNKTTDKTATKQADKPTTAATTTAKPADKAATTTPPAPAKKENKTEDVFAKIKKEKSFTEPLFGKGKEVVKYVDSKLLGATYYLVSGHGGPDPGAMSTYGGQTISEDEYAYDVILRLARQLISHRANVHIIIQDPDDGIRDDAALKCDDDETCMGAPIPLDQVERLRQRSDSINALYDKERKGYCRSVFIHVDSRSKDKRIDIFFYHYMKSTRGEKLAKTLQAKMAQKYAKHQPNRGFSGEVKERDLFVLRETNPAGVFIEIANIQNHLDMVRLAKSNNREAMARWIAEGIIEDFQKE